MPAGDRRRRSFVTLSMPTARRLAIAVATAATLSASIAGAANVSLPVGAVLAIPNPNLRTVRIAIDDANGIEAALIRIQYNRDLAAATQVRTTTITSGCVVEVNTTMPNNEVQISMACTTPRTGSGAMFEIDFAGVSAGLTNLSFLQCTFNEGNPGCQTSNGTLRVTTCALDVDSSGTANANTDGVYIFRALPPTLQTVVPPAFRQVLPSIPLDSVILDNVNAILPLLNVDGIGGSSANTDGVYIFRALPPTLQTVVPPAFRQIDPNIPSDQVITANVFALCP